MGADLAVSFWAEIKLAERRYDRSLVSCSAQEAALMDLPNAPIALEGSYVTHFFTVKDQEKSKDFYVRILGGKG